MSHRGKLHEVEGVMVFFSRHLWEVNIVLLIQAEQNLLVLKLNGITPKKDCDKIQQGHRATLYSGHERNNDQGF